MPVFWVQPGENLQAVTSVYPNPVSDVHYFENSENLTEMSIYSVQGQLIYQSDVSGRFQTRN